VGVCFVRAVNRARRLPSIARCGARTPLIDSEPLAEPDASLPDDGPPPACIPGRFVLEHAIAQLMFVIDRSGSMAFDLRTDTRGGTSRWSTLENGLRQTIIPLTGQLAMGAKFFPEPVGDFAGVDESCRSDLGVAIAPGLNNAYKILDVFAKTRPRGGTPTAEAVRIAAEYVASQRKVGRAIVLATDGAPNCNGGLAASTCVCTLASCDRPLGAFDCLDDTRTVKVIGDIFTKRQIPVYVVGIGGGELPAYIATLDAMAVAGGRAAPTSPKYYDVQTPAEMSGALTTIRDSVTRCTYLTPSVPTDANAISIEIDGVLVRRDPSHIEGWDWVDQTYGVIGLFGTACSDKDAPKVSGVVACTGELGDAGP
jgi:hypothetical protein